MSDVNLVDNTPAVRAALKTAVERGLWAIGSTAERHAKEACPVDTGRLRNSIAHAEDNEAQAVYIGTNVEYAAFVEYGTSKHPRPQPFLRPAATEHGAEYKNLMETAMRAGD